MTKYNTLQPYTRIYNKLQKIIPNLDEYAELGIESGVSKLNSPGFMDLHYNYAGKDKDGFPMIALTHYYESNGDLVPDPDMQIRLMPKYHMAEALTFQNQYVFQQVYEEVDGVMYVSPGLKRDLNEFLDQWLSNIIEQGHTIDLSEGKKNHEKERGEELRQSKENEAGKGADLDR